MLGQISVSDLKELNKVFGGYYIIFPTGYTNMVAYPTVISAVFYIGCYALATYTVARKKFNILWLFGSFGPFYSLQLYIFNR